MTEQLKIDFISAPAFRQVARREFILRRVAENADALRYVTVDWLQRNWEVWERFDFEANRVYVAGRQHYGARRIGEFLRHETAAREAQGELKLNDHVWPDFARIWLILNPERDGFFELRGRAA